MRGSIWHRQMGRLNQKDLCKMRDGAVEGINVLERFSPVKAIVMCAMKISIADYLFQIVDQGPMIYCKLYMQTYVVRCRKSHWEAQDIS